MSDDAPDSKRGTNARSLANLRPRRKGDPNPNPTGYNGRTRGEYVAKFLDGTATTDLLKTLIKKLGLPADTTLIDAILHRDVLAALGKSDMSRKSLIEQYGGKPRQQMEITGKDGGPVETVNYTTDEKRKILAALMAEPDDGKEADADPTTGDAAADAPKTE